METEFTQFLADCTVDGVTPADQFVEVLLTYAKRPITDGFRREARELLRAQGLLLEDVNIANDVNVIVPPFGTSVRPGQAPPAFGGRVTRGLGGRLAVHPITGKYIVR